MAETFRRTKIEKFVKRLEAKVPVMPDAKAEMLKEVIADIRHEFKLEGREKGMKVLTDKPPSPTP